MKILPLALIIGLLSIFSSAVSARNQVETFSISEAMSQADTESLIGNTVKFYFGKQSHPDIGQNMGVFSTNKKTNAFNKSDLQACRRAFFSALISLRDRAMREGGDAVINIQSNYKSNLFSSETEFQCGAGNVVAGVALKGQVVKLK